MKTKLCIGDTIQCHDKYDCIRTMMELERKGVETDFLYEKDGEKGFWLEVKKVMEDGRKES